MAGSNSLIIGLGADTAKLKADLTIAEAVVKDSTKRLKDAGKDALATNDRSGVDAAAAALVKAEQARNNIKAALKDVNSEGEKIGGGLFASMSSAFGRIRTSMNPVADGFKDLNGHAKAFAGSLSNVAERIFPSFKDAVAVGGILGGAALVSLVKSTADWGHELTTNAKILGITTNQLRALQENAKKLGVDPDVLVNSLLKFEDAMQKAVENQKKLGIEGAQIIEGKNTQVSYGIANITKLASDSAKRVTDVAVAGIGKYQDQLRLMYTFTKQANDARGLPTEAWDVFRTKAETILRGAGEETDKLRDKLLRMGADLKAHGPFEALERSLPGFMGNLEKLGVNFIDPLTGRAKDLTAAWTDFIEKFSKLNSFEQTRLGREFFGKQYFDSGISKVLTQGVDETGKAKPESIDELKAKLHEARIQGSGFDPQVASAEKLWQTLRKVDQTLSGIKKALVLPFVEVFQGPAESMDQLLERVKTKVAEMSRAVATVIKPLAIDIGKIFSGQKPDTTLGQWLVNLKAQVVDFIGYIQAGFGRLVTALGNIARLINSVFGTKLTGQGLAIGAAVFYMAGGFKVLSTGLTLAGALLSPAGAILVGLTVMAITLYKLPTIVSAVGRGFHALGDAIDYGLKWLLGDALGGLASLFITGPMKLVGDSLQVVADLIRVIGDLLRGDFKQALVDLKKAGEDFGAMWVNLGTTILGVIKDVIAGLGSLVTKAVEAAQSIASALGLAGKTGASVPGVGGGAVDLGGTTGPAVMQASGGYISGPGTGTSDSIPARLSNGEFVLKAASVAKIGVGALNRLNNIGYAMGGLVGQALGFSPSLPSFAGGGLVGGGSSFGTVNLTVGGQTASLNVSNQDGFGQLSRIARSEQRTSAGAKPTWYGS